MGRRQSFFSKRSQEAFKKQSPESKIAGGIVFFIISTISIIIGLTTKLSNTKYSDFGIFIILFGVLFFIFAIYFTGIGLFEKQNQKKFDESIVKSNMSTIDQMDGKTFEKYLAALFKLQGYKTELTKASGDYGVDIIIYSSTEDKTIIQAKCYSKKVTISAIQEISAARSYYGTNNAWVITNNYFTQPAINLAAANGIKLIDRTSLANLINSTEGAANVTANEIIIKNPQKKEVLHEHSFSNTTLQTNIFSQNDYNNNYVNQLQKIKNEAIVLYGLFDFEGVSKKIIEAGKIEKKSKKDYISLHFFYQDMVNIIYALRYSFENAINQCLQLCDKDIEILKHTDLKNVTTYSLSRKAIIYENQGKIQEAIDVCNYAIKNNFLDNGRPFIIRKERLLKKLNNG